MSSRRNEHDNAIDRALAALDTEAGARRVMSHLENPIGSPVSGIELQDLVAALTTLRELGDRTPT